MKKTMTIKRFLFMALVLSLVNSVTGVSAIVVDFDDLNYDMHLSGTEYAGLTWETGNIGYKNNQGYWKVPSSFNSYPQSQPYNAINAWGCTHLGISFPTEVDVLGAYFAAQGANDSWTTGIQVHGYRGGLEVVATPWFDDIDTHPDWFAMNLNNVDRIVIESIPVDQGGGWYGMDDLTYIPEPTTLLLFGLGTLVLLRKHRL